MVKIITGLLALFLSAEKMAAQCAPQLLDCGTDPVTFCDFTLNSNQYWMDISWWDNVNQSHDLAETETDLHFSLRDTCPGSNLTIRCLLMLDLDRDGDFETLVNTDNPPAAGMVNFDNSTGPGMPRPFDSRPVTTDQKWRFALQSSQSGDTLTARLRWNTTAAPDVFAMPELPHGVHKVRWEVSDNSGILKTCEYVFTVKDCKSPTIVCLNGLSANIMPTHQIQLWATDFLQYTEDNITPSPYIRLGIRKAGTGTGFPVDFNGNPITSVVFDCTELGTQLIELWAIDLAGNGDYCVSTAIIQDVNNNCLGYVLTEACTTPVCGWGGLEDAVQYRLDYNLNGQNVTEFYQATDCGPIGSQPLPFNTGVIITPSSEDFSSGYVNQLDLVILGKHIAGTDLFDEPYQFVAGDANRDGMLSTLDVIACNKHILGIEPLDHPWRFVDKSFVNPWPADPLSGPLPEFVTVNTSNLPPGGVEFMAIRICDVSCGNVVGFFDLEAEKQHLVGDPQPNPTNGNTLLPLQLLYDDLVSFELTDASGRLVFVQTVRLPSGAAMFDVPADAMSVPGLYFWRIRAGDVVKAGKISKI